MLGVVLPDITNPFFAEYARALELAAAAHGYVLVVANSDSNDAQESRIVSDLSNRHVDGLLIPTVLPRSGSVPPRFRNVRVLIDCSTPFAGYAAVGPASRDGARALVDHLITVHSHQSVALIMGRESSEPVPEPREQGWSDAFQAHELPPGPIVRTSFVLRGGYEGALQLLSWPTPPRAIFAASDQLCFGALKAIREAGLRCPDDIAIVSYDGATESEYCWPPVTIARQPIQEMADAAIEAVLDPGSSPAYQRFEVELVIRESCGCRRSPA